VREVVDRYSLLKNGYFAEWREGDILPLHWNFGNAPSKAGVESTIEAIDVPDLSYSHPILQTWQTTDTTNRITEVFGQTVVDLEPETEYELTVVAHNQSSNRVIVSAFELQGYDPDDPETETIQTKLEPAVINVTHSETAKTYRGTFRTSSVGVVRLGARIQQKDPTFAARVIWYKWALHPVVGKKSNLVPNGEFTDWPDEYYYPQQWTMEPPGNLRFTLERLLGEEYLGGKAVRQVWMRPQPVHRSKCMGVTLEGLHPRTEYTVDLVAHNPSANRFRLSAWEATGTANGDLASVVLSQRLSYAILQIDPRSPYSTLVRGKFVTRNSGPVRLLLSCEENGDNTHFPAELIVDEWRVHESAPASPVTQESSLTDEPSTPASGPSSASTPRATTEQRPNIVWVLFDALRAENLSCYGYSRETSPNIDALARAGVLFENNFSQGFWTRVSLSSMATGRYFGSVIDSYPRRMDTFKPPGAGERMIAEVLRENGYYTALITAHAAFPPGSLFSSSFDKCIYVRSPQALITGYDRFQDLNREIASFLENPPDQPFFLFVHALDTHFPHTLDKPFNRWLEPNYSSPQIDTLAGQPVASAGLSFTEEDREYLTGLYDGGISYADHHFGELISLLRELKLLDSCLVIVSSDHGDLLGEDGSKWGHPEETYDLLMHVPLVICGPLVPNGVRVTQLSQNADIMATLIDILKLDTDATTDGSSLRPLWEDPEDARVHEYVFAKLYGVNDAAPVYVLRDRQFKLVYDPVREIEHLWELPESGQHRRDMKETQQAVLGRMKEYVRAELIPLWEEYSARPDTAIRVKVRENLDYIENRDDVYIPEPGQKMSPEWHRDGKWLLYDDKLWSALWLEQAPPLRFSIPVENGSYLVQFRLLASEDIDGHPASKIKVLIQDDSDFKYIREAKPIKNHRLLYGEAGLYKVEDGTLHIRVETSNTTDWAIFDEIRLVPATWHLLEDEEDLADRSDQLKALGYL